MFNGREYPAIYTPKNETIIEKLGITEVRDSQQQNHRRYSYASKEGRRTINEAPQSARDGF